MILDVTGDLDATTRDRWYDLEMRWHAWHNKYPGDYGEYGSICEPDDDPREIAAYDEFFEALRPTAEEVRWIEALRQRISKLVRHFEQERRWFRTDIFDFKRDRPLRLWLGRRGYPFVAVPNILGAKDYLFLKERQHHVLLQIGFAYWWFEKSHWLDIAVRQYGWYRWPVASHRLKRDDLAAWLTEYCKYMYHVQWDRHPAGTGHTVYFESATDVIYFRMYFE